MIWMGASIFEQNLKLNRSSGQNVEKNIIFSIYLNVIISTKTHFK